jgi:dihydropteroate synthase
MIYKIGKKEFDFSKNYYIMGILNVTPDSFFDGGKHSNLERAFKFALEMAEAGADIIDIGGESSRPGAKAISAELEIERVLPVIERMIKEIDIPISIDTYKSKVADECLKSGVHIINDISGLMFDPEMIKIVCKHDSFVIIQHIQGTPKTMQLNPHYEDVVSEIFQYFLERIEYCRINMVNKIILDPGIGFGKNTSHNLEIFNKLSEFKKLGFPILIGPSRKRFIGDILNVEPAKRLIGTAAAVAISVYNGADIIRVHDVKEMKQVAEIAIQIKNIK